VFTVVIVAIFALAGADPYVNLATTMTGLGTLGIVLLQAAASLSVLAFFRRRADRHWWRTGLAPVLGLLGLIASAVLVVQNFELLTGTTSTLINSLPWAFVVVLAAGAGFAFWLRARRPERYAALSRVAAERGDVTELPAPAEPGAEGDRRPEAA
jgi:amino acid transporter